MVARELAARGSIAAIWFDAKGFRASRVEPAVDVGANQLAPTTHAHRGTSSSPAAARPARAEARERRRAPPFDDKIDDVRPHEDQRRSMWGPRAESRRGRTPEKRREARRAPLAIVTARSNDASTRCRRRSGAVSRNGRRGGRLPGGAGRASASSTSRLPASLTLPPNPIPSPLHTHCERKLSMPKHRCAPGQRTRVCGLCMSRAASSKSPLESVRWCVVSGMRSKWVIQLRTAPDPRSAALPRRGRHARDSW